jgi:hypothetical protein
MLECLRVILHWVLDSSLSCVVCCAAACRYACSHPLNCDLHCFAVGQPTSLTYSKALGLLCGEAVAAQVVPESAGEELGCVARPLSDSEVSDAGLNALTAADAPSLLVLAESKGLCGSDAALRGRLEGRILQLLLGGERTCPASSDTCWHASLCPSRELKAASMESCSCCHYVEGTWQCPGLVKSNMDDSVARPPMLY